jgi:hypothetical protein
MFSYLLLCFVPRLWLIISLLVISEHVGACQESGLHYGVQGAVISYSFLMHISQERGEMAHLGQCSAVLIHV